MTRDDIIKLAREAGMTGLESGGLLENFERFAALVAAAERDACVRVCDDWPNGRDDVYSIGVAIRARGETK